MFYFELMNIISIPCGVWSHGSRNKIELVFWIVSKYFKEAAQFPVPFSFFKGFQT